jgi:serine carboxypeptidase 1
MVYTIFRWDGLKTFLSLPRQTLYCGLSKGAKAFVRSYNNLHFYWILGAGHYVSINTKHLAWDLLPVWPNYTGMLP